MDLKLGWGLDELEKILVRNIANDLLQLEFHRKSTSKRLREYYGEANVNRQALVSDTQRRLRDSQRMLQFYRRYKPSLIENYGDKDPAGDLGEFSE